MECETCQLQMVNLFDAEINPTEYAKITDHIRLCPQCQLEFEKTEKVIGLLKTTQQPVAPFLLKQNIMNQLKMEEAKMSNAKAKSIKMSPRYKRILSVAAALAIFLIAIPIIDSNTKVFNRTARAANSLIESSMNASQLIRSMVIKFKVRTDAFDNFSLVGTNYQMVKHTIYKSFGTPEKWRLEKEGRILVSDGEFQYLQATKAQQFYRATIGYNMAEWFQILLEPAKILMKEQGNLKGKDSKFKMEEKGEEILFTITSGAQGNFINDYCRNSSILESDNRREYVFDKNTKLIKGLRIFILEGKKETLILELDKIEYNTSIDPALFSMVIPAGANWNDLTQTIDSDVFKNISSRRAAELLFEGMAKRNWELVTQTFSLFKGTTKNVSELKDIYGGLTIVGIGEPFKSGQYPGEFVPYEVKLKSGKVKRHNLALRNDNPNKVWIVDGGF